MCREFQGLVDNDGFATADLSVARKPIDSDKAGVQPEDQSRGDVVVVRGEACLIRRGFMRGKGADFRRTISPIPIPVPPSMLAIAVTAKQRN